MGLAPLDPPYETQIKSDNMSPGDVVLATVVRADEWGITLESHGKRIIVLSPEVSWTYEFRDCREIASPGDQFEVLILRYAEQVDTYVGSTKDAHPENDPWKRIGGPILGQRFRGSVKYEIARGDGTQPGDPAGYMVEVAKGVSAYLSRESLPPQLRLEVGDPVEVQVTHVDHGRRNIAVDIVPPRIT